MHKTTPQELYAYNLRKQEKEEPTIKKEKCIIILYNNAQLKEHISPKNEEDKTGSKKVEKMMAKINSKHGKFDNQCQNLPCLQCC